MTIVNWLNLREQVFNKLTLLVSLIELSEVGVSAHDEVVDTPNFYPFNVIVAGLDKVVVE